eukprot:m.113306 g.113306  ORF g.113306 m.113306 type:complete len:265 (+) comp17074_c0_seq1:364-1158(+)
MAAPRCKRAFFIGNSLTYYNSGVDKHFSNMRHASASNTSNSASVEQTATNTDRLDSNTSASIVTERFAVGGASLEHLWTTTSAVDRIRNFCNPVEISASCIEPKKDIASKGNAVVVIQEDLPETSVYNFHKHLKYFVRETRSAGGIPVLYMCWPYQRLKWCTWDELILEHQKAAHALGIKLAPVGTALRTAVQERPDLNLFAPDQEHPSPLGTHLAAVIIYCAVYGEPPHTKKDTYAPLGCEDYSDADITYVEELAWRICSASA